MTIGYLHVGVILLTTRILWEPDYIKRSTYLAKSRPDGGVFLAPYKGIQDSPGFWIPLRGFRIPKPRIPNSSIKISKFPQAKKILGISDLDSLAWREPWASGKSVYCLFPLQNRTISRECSQIISTSRWVKKVEVFTSMLTCISYDGNDQY